MKKKLTLLVVAMFISSVAGCGCCRRARDWVCRGAVCRTPAPAVAPIAMPAPQPVAACPSCPPVAPMASYDPGCGYFGEQTYGYPGYSLDGSGVIDLGWSSSCPSCEGGSYVLPSEGTTLPVDSGAVFPGPADNGA